MAYEPRESIHPRAFALRHALLEELKLRLQSAAAARDQLIALARAIDVDYVAQEKHFVVRGLDGKERRVPLEAFRFFEGRDDAVAVQWEREDAVLAANRAMAAALVDTLLAAAPTHEEVP